MPHRASHSNEPAIVRAGHAVVPLGFPSGLRSADRPPSARWSPEHDAGRDEPQYPALQARPSLSPRQHRPHGPTPSRNNPSKPEANEIVPRSLLVILVARTVD